MKQLLRLAALIAALAMPSLAQYKLSNGLLVDAFGRIQIANSASIAIVNSHGFPLDSSGNLVVNCESGCGGGGGSVSISGTPTVGQGALWTDATTIKGVTFSGDGTISSLGAIAITKIGGVTPGGTCTNQVVTVISSSGVPTCTTLSSAYVGSSIAVTGVDINTSSQVTVTHLAAALPIAQGGIGAATFATHTFFGNNTGSTAAPSATAFPGSDKYCYFNDGGALGADTACQFDKATGKLTITGALVTGSGSTGALLGTEGTDPGTAAVGLDLLWADSTAHRHKVHNNNGAADTLALFTDKLSVFAATTSAELAGVISNETGSGVLVFGTSPALTTPDLGTPSAATLTNATGLPISSGVSGLGTGVATFLGTPSSANLAAAITNETGSGAAVFGTSPTLTTPVIASIVNTGTVSFPTSTDTLVGKATTDTLTNKTLVTGTSGNVVSKVCIQSQQNTITLSTVSGTQTAIWTCSIPANLFATNNTCVHARSIHHISSNGFANTNWTWKFGSTATTAISDATTTTNQQMWEAYICENGTNTQQLSALPYLHSGAWTTAPVTAAPTETTSGGITFVLNATCSATCSTAPVISPDFFVVEMVQ